VHIVARGPATNLDFQERATKGNPAQRAKHALRMRQTDKRVFERTLNVLGLQTIGKVDRMKFVG
jgi:hypothetical protein